MITPNKLSIIIPSFKRPEGLRQLLDSIWKQQPWASQIEVIIVDNAPQAQEDIGQLRDEFSRKGLNVKLTHEPVSGVAWARNTGINVAKGEFISFLDDDEEISEGYLHLLLEKLETADQNCIFGGPYVPILQPPSPEWVKPHYFSIGFGDQPIILDDEKFLSGGNTIISRQVINRIGGFSSKFGHVGAKIDYGEDTDLLLRAVRSGASQNYDPKLYVWHHIPTRKQNLRWFITQKQRASNQKAVLYIVHHPDMFDPKKKVSNQLHFLRKVVADFLNMIICLITTSFRDRVGYPYYQNYFVEKVLPVYGNILFKWRLFILIGKQPLLG